MHTSDRRLSFLGLGPTGDLADLTCYTSQRGKVVWFLKSPPLVPASELQRRQRMRFTAAAESWRGLQQTMRTAWLGAAIDAGLRIHGYDLWIFWQLKRDRSIIQTIERQTHRTLIPP